jgi:predicted O-methyltransferase YrrM
MITSLLDQIAFRLSKNKLKKYLNNNDDIGSIINATKNYTGHRYYDRISMSQKYTEIKNLAEAVRAINPKTIVEIGTRKGGTLFVWCRFTNAAKIISIDLNGGIHGGGYPPQKQKLYKAFLMDQPARKVNLLQEDSHSNSTLMKLNKLLDGNKIDFLFIDGDHRYEGVKQDFEMYSPLVRKGGIVAFHDIIPNTTKHEDASSIEVPLFWKEIKGKFKHNEFIESKQQSNMGIGILYM